MCVRFNLPLQHLPRGCCGAILGAFLLILHCGLLAWSACRHSPVIDETGHLPAGLSHWRLHRFDLYNVNPPLVRTVATLPLRVMDVPIDFSGYEVQPMNRSEFQIGHHWISAEPNTFLRDFTIARWACIPFSLLGAGACFLWGRDLYGSSAGWIALCLWCFSPSILAHGALITPDAGAAAVGVAACYVFRKWLIRPTLGRAAGAGVLLGLTLLTKFTWLFLVGLWPVFGLLLRSIRRLHVRDASSPSANILADRKTCRLRDEARHLLLLLLLAWWVLNNGYLFEDSFERLGDFRFSSEALSGRAAGETVRSHGGNRFRGTWLEDFRVPVPRNFLLGIDHIKFEYELGYSSYLRGVTKHGGWWYYYLYAMLVKMPVGTLLLIFVAAGSVLCSIVTLSSARTRGRISSMLRFARARRVPATSHSGKPGFSELYSEAGASEQVVRNTTAWFDALYLLTPAVCVLWLVSSQTGFNHHLRYVLPAFPFLFIFAGRSTLLLKSRHWPVRAIPVICVGWMIVSSLSVYPHSLSYFNEFVGGPINGWKHLDKSNLDWGQDMILVKEWVQRNSEVAPLYIQPSGFLTPQQMGIAVSDLDWSIARDGLSSSGRKFRPGWYIMGLTRLVDPDHPCHELLQREPDDYIGFSMRVYHIEADTEGSVMAE